MAYLGIGFQDYGMSYGLSGEAQESEKVSYAVKLTKWSHGV